jgi:hypothetical protein
VSPGLTATFQVGLTGFDPYWRIQWRTNGIAISGATNLAYTTQPVAPADNGRNYSVTVSNSVGGVVSASATLTVADVVPPGVASISSRGNPNGITLQWTEALSNAATNAGNYSVNNGVTIGSVRFGASNSVVVLATSPLTEGTTYTVTISNVQDLQGLTINPNPTLTNFVHGAGYESKPITFKKFNNIGGGTIPDLTNNAAFPNSPSYTALPVFFEDPSPSDDDPTNNNYGCQLSAVYVAPASGQYTFYMSSDDNGVTYFSTDDQPAHRVQICYEPQWNGARDYTGTDRRNASAPENRSAPITLTAGQKCYLEALMKEGTGGNNVSVAVREPGQPVPTTPIPSSRFAPVRYFSGQTFYTLGPVLFLGQPVSQTINEGDAATWSVTMDGTPPWFAQWFSNGVAIAGATNITLVTQPLNATAQGANYSCRVSNEFSSVISTSAVLNVIPDTVRPTLVLAQNIGTTNVSITFSEPVDPATGTNRFNYSLSGGLSITRADFGGDARTIVLTTGPVTYGSNYVITVNNVRDRAATPNVILANSQLAFLATDFTPQDIGGPAQPGSLTPVAGGYTVMAGGTGIGGTTDQFHFDYQLQSGDFDVKLRVQSMSLSDTWAKAGVMARESLAANSRFAASMATPTLAGCFYQYRDPPGAAAVTTGSQPVNYPFTWLRLRRLGNQFTAYAGVDGQVWSQLGSATIAMSNVIYLGMAAAAGTSGQSAQVEFREWMNGAGGTIGAINSGSEPLGPSSRKTPIVMSEIMYKPAARTDGRNLEFVELFNSNPFYEDIGGYRVSGDIDFTFPPGTTIPGGGFLVIAKVPPDIQAIYGISNLTGPYTNSLKASGTLRLRNNLDAILLEVNYRDTLPWPVAADGAGHSMVLARPSYGEAYPQAWAQSDVIGGSPGTVEAFRPSPLRNVLINEFLAHTDDPLPDFIELYNHANQPVDISGCFLSDDASTNKFRIPPATVIPARGFVFFDESQLGFGLSAAGEKIFFVNSNATRVLDAISFEAQANGISSGRFPDGATEIYPLATRTPGAANGAIRIHDVVINEIMYAPISGDSDDEYIELYNRGPNPVSLAGWRFVDGIDFTFATNSVLATNAYLVIARNLTNLLAKYPALNSNNTVGNWEGTLANSGERIALAMPDLIITTNSSGNPRTNTVYITVDEVTYGAGGRWGNWAKEGGSSLELVDPESNHRLAYNWADSDETAKAPWTLIEFTGVLDQGSTYNNEAINRLELMLLGEGECLIDNVEVVGPGNTNRIVNSTFETGLSGWTAQGNHIRSTLEATEGYLSSQSLHVRASSRGDTGANRIRTPINGALTSGNTATLRMRARWLRGWPEPLMRLKGNYLEATARLTLPFNLGTPGARNSRWANNTGPAIYEVTHTPVVPAAGENVLVTARVHDPDVASAFVLKYRIDPSTTYTSTNMLDNGTGGDAIANDGMFTATIPGQAAGTMIAFYLEATDTLGATSQFPRGASPTGPECLVRVGDPTPTGSFGIYRQWLTQNNINTWINRPSLSNERVEGTFVYGNFRAIYNMGTRYAGSPYHQGFSSPLANCHYSIELPLDDLLLGTENFNKVHAPGNGAFDDNTIQREQTGYWMARQIGLPWNNRRYVAMFVNGNRRGTLMEDTQTPGSDVIDSLFPDDSNGDLFKLQPWFEFDDVTVTGGNGAGFQNKSWCVLNNYLTTGNVKKQARYRWNFLVRAANGTANNYTNVFNLVDAASTATNAWTNFAAKIDALVDTEEWLRIFGIEHAVGNWDSFGNRNAQNMYGYKPDFGKWKLLIWDYNIILGNSGSDGPTGDDLFQYQTADTNIVKIYNAPPFRRAYWRAFKDVADGPMNNANVDPVMDAKYAAFVANGISVTAPSAALKGWISSRRSYLLSQLAAVDAPFATGSDFSTNNNLITLTGTAPVGVKTIKINGIAYPAQWSSVTSWTILVPIGPGSNLLTLQGYDTYGNPVAGASDTINVTNTGPSALPDGNVVINEIMYHPAVADASFVELHNIHPSVTFDLSNWRLDGADFTFAEGTLIRPGGFAVVANDAFTFAATYGVSIPLAGVFNGSLDNGGETLRLIKPGVTPDLDQVIDEVRYDDDLPWPTAADGFGPSLQLIDPTQDNYRAGNWTAVPTNAAPPWFTPGATNSVRASLAPFPLLWINELQVFNTNGVMDNFGEREPWIELYNNGPTNVSFAGVFLTDSYSNLTRWPFPAGATIAPGQFLLVWADGEIAENSGTNYHTNFRLTNSAGGIALVRTNGGRTNVLDYINYFALSTDRSFGSFPDGQPRTRQLFQFATPRATNNPALAPVSAVINEWMADNAGPDGFPDPADGLFQDWFELFNPNTNAVDLSGYYLTDNLGQPTKFLIPANTVIPARGYLLVWADNNTAQNGLNADLHANFQLNNGGEALGLFAPDGTPQSTVVFGQQIQNVSQGRWPDGDTNAVYFMTNFTPRASNLVTSSNTAPVLSLIGNKTANENSLLTFTAAASDADFPSQTLTFTLDPGAPVGASIHPITGTFNWLPAETQGPGVYSVTIRVTDNGVPNLSDTETITITVNEVNSVPVLAPIGNKTVNELSVLAFTATASDGDIPANTFTFSLDPGAPAGATITPAGAFTWTPSESQGPGMYAITVRVTDSGVPALSDSETINVTVNEVNFSPTLNAIADQTINEGVTVSFTATATDSDVPAQTLTYSIVSGPSNATINASSGAFSWTPNEGQAPSTNLVTIRVTDNGIPSLNHSRTFTVVVNEVNSAPVLAPVGNKSASEGILLTFTNSAADPDLPAQALTFSLDPGAPVSAAITTNGVFTWIPNESQGGTTNSITIRVTDNGSPPLSDSETITITVAEVNAAPVLNAIGNKTINEGSTLTFTATATDSDTPAQTLTYSLDAGAPPGAGINPANGVFTWTPTESQGPSTNAITVRVTDDGSPSLNDFETITVVVNEVNTPPVLAPIGNKVVDEGTLLSFTASATDSDVPAQTLTFSLDPGAPAGATITSGGLFTWTPTELQGPGTNTITVRVTDNGSPALNDFEIISVIVNEANNPPALASIGNKTVNEGTTLSFTATATDSDTPAQTLTFSLDPGAPATATIGATTGIFSWTPSESDGPSTNTVTIRVTDNGVPAASDFETITIVVSEVNNAPVLAGMGNRSVNEGATLAFTASATDSDLPAQTLTFSLDPGAPPGASINPTNGAFTWTPTEAQGPATNTITVRVTDNGSPALNDFETIVVTVAEVNLAPTLVSIGNKSVKEGSLLTFTASATDPDLPANALTFSLDPGVPAGATINPTTGVFSWTPPLGTAPATNSVTIRVTDNGSPQLSASETILIQVTAQTAPIVALISPTNNSLFALGADISLQATATDADGAVTNVTFFADGLRLGSTTSPPYTLTWSNAASGSHVLYATATDNNGLTNISTAVSIDVRAAILTNVTLISTGSLWRYFDKGTDQDTNWINIAFDDSSWSNGLAQLGYGDGDEATVISYGPDINNKYITSYFRRAFNVPDPSSISGLALRILRDDGAIVYLNASEVFRTAMPTGTVNYLTRANVTVGGADENTFYSNNLSPSFLVAGLNLLAVEVHQVTNTSTDLSFDFSLIATQNVFAPWITGQPADQRLPLAADAQFAVVARGTAPLMYQWRRNATPITGQNLDSLTLTNITTADSGDYSVIISNAAGSVTSAVVRLIITAPVLDPIGNKTVAEGNLLTFTATATDPDFPSQTLTFSLDPGAPAGAAINPNSGAFSFTPTESQGPGSYPITVRVTDNGTPPQSDSETLTVTVTEVNAAPVLSGISNQTISEGATLAFTVTVSDPDIPAQTLTCSLAPGAPAGASIDPVTGAFTWTPSESQGPSTNTITVRVTDNGSPALSDTKTFTVIVNEVNTSPVLTPIGNKSIDEGSTLSFTASASDSDLPAQSLTFSLDPGAPPGAAITAAGQFTWTPTEAQGPGTNQITIRVTDSGAPPQSAFETVSVVVREVNIAPMLAPIADQTVDEGATVTFTATAADPDQPAQTLIFTLDPGAPAGAAIDPNTGAFTWITGESDGPGTNIVTVRVTDNGTPTMSHSRPVRIVVREVNEAPVIDPLSDRTVVEGTLLSFTASASDVDLPAQQLTFSLAGTVPSGAAIATTGLFTWTPSEAQGPSSTTITVRVTDSGSPPRSATANFTIVVLETNSAPVIAPIPNTNILEGMTLSFTATATDADLPAQALTFSLDPGAPTNASITAAGQFTWTPDESFGGTTNVFALRVTDDGTSAKAAIATFSVIVTESNSPPVLAPIGNRSASEDGFLSFVVSATDPDTPAQQLTFSLDPGAPAGAAMDPLTGEFTWTPNEDQGPATHTFTIRVTDNGIPARSAAETISITVAEVNTTPTLAGISNQVIDENSILSFRATATDPDRPAQTLTFTLDPGAPPGASITTDGLFTWATTEAHGPGTNSVTIRVTDSSGASDSATILIIVNEVNASPLLASIADRSVNAGTEIAFTASATDSDLPPQQLTFSLDGTSLFGATIDPSSGVFRWTPALDHTPATNSFTVRVTDSGTPALSDAKSLRIIVITAPRILDIARAGSSVTITWRANPGKTYRVQYRDDLSAGIWLDLDGPITASGNTAIKIDSNANAPQRFYRVTQTD